MGPDDKIAIIKRSLFPSSILLRMRAMIDSPQHRIRNIATKSPPSAAVHFPHQAQRKEKIQLTIH
jgi:hypothetical protein